MDTIPTVLLSSLERAPWGWSLLLVVLIIITRVWPIINAQRIAVQDRIADRKERKDNSALVDKGVALDDCKVRLDAMDARLDRSEARAHQFELKLIGTMNAYRVIEADVELKDPESSALKQARRILVDTYRVTDTMPTDITATAKHAT
jgi:hypothetical protein